MIKEFTTPYFIGIHANERLYAHMSMKRALLQQNKWSLPSKWMDALNVDRDFWDL